VRVTDYTVLVRRGPRLVGDPVFETPDLRVALLAVGVLAEYAPEVACVIYAGTTAILRVGAGRWRVPLHADVSAPVAAPRSA
jgi:hypothetical protein